MRLSSLASLSSWSVPRRNFPVRWQGKRSADGERYDHSRPVSWPSMVSASRVASAPCLYSAGNPGRSTDWTPVLTSKLPAPPTSRRRLIPAFSVDDGSGAFDLLIIEVGIAPARVEGADDHLVASHETSDVIFIVDIALLGVKLRCACNFSGFRTMAVASWLR